MYIASGLINLMSPQYAAHKKARIYNKAILSRTILIMIGL